MDKDFDFQFKINGMNHNCRFELDKLDIERKNAERRNLMARRLREAREQGRNSVFDPNHMVFNLRDTQTAMILDPNEMTFNFRKK